MKLLRMVVLMAALVALGASAFAGDIVTVPTANQLKQGQMDFAYYYLGLDNPAPAPQSVNAQTFYLGVTDQLELDVHRYDLDKVGSSAIINASWSLMREDTTRPDLVIGGRNILEEEVAGPPSQDRSWFISAAKTLNLPAEGPPALPIVRLHLSLGTADPSLLGEERHKGLFGGIQSKLTQQIGAVALHDGQDLITGLTFTPNSLPALTFKGGTYGKHFWVGLSYAK